MRLARFVVVVLVLVGSAGILTAPARATPNAGPWDVQIAYGVANPGGLGNELFIEAKVTVDTDDDVSSRYRLCYSLTRSSPAFGPYNESDRVQPASDGLLTAGPNSKASGTGSSSWVINSAWVVLNTPDENSACASQTPMPIRGRGNVTTVPSANIQDDGGTSSPSAPSPLPSGSYPLSDPPAPEGTCSRTLGNTGNDYFGTFRLVLDEPAPTGSTDAFSWDFGDGSTDATTAVAQHSYGDLSTMPDNGWTATVTVTRTGDGTTFLEGPVTVDCAVRVDFRNPDQSDAGGAAPDDEDSDCPSGFGWLNPLAITKVLKCLFIPTQTGEDTDALMDALDGSVLGIVTVPIGILSDAWGRVWSSAASTSLDCDGPDLEINFGLPDQEGDLTVNPMTACDPPLSTVAGIVKALLSASVYIGGALACLRILGGAMGWRVGLGATADKGDED